MPRPDLRDPWLIACWPGMGAVALLAGHHLVEVLGAEEAGEMAGDAWFDVANVKVKGGLVQPASRPRNVFHAYRSRERTGRDLLVFLGEAQPQSRGWSFCEALLDEAAARGAHRVVTFAAMAMPMAPGSASRVFAAATDEDVLRELPKNVIRLKEGEIGGLNGVLLGAAVQRGMEGICLLGSFPFLAPGVPNPSASAAVLRVFGRLAGLAIDVSVLEEKGREVDQQLEKIVEQMQEQAKRRAEGGEAPEAEEPESAAAEPESQPEPRVRNEDRARIERLFRRASDSRDQALALKAELDRLGLFREYEDRFLDLFRRAE